MNRYDFNKLCEVVMPKLSEQEIKAYWLPAMKSLAFSVVIQEHIMKIRHYKIKKNKKTWTWCEYESIEANDEDMVYIIKWVKANIDKERLKEWLSDE